MIVPSIDLLDGRVVQLVGGEDLAIEAGDPAPILERFARVGEVAVVDIDAARGTGSNRAAIEPLLSGHRIRVGGGIRDVSTALQWLDAGAAKVIVGTAARPELLAQLPKDRVIVAADARAGSVVSHGWRRDTGRSLLDTVRGLRDLCSGFLVTFVEREGRLAGTDIHLARAVVDAAGAARVTIAGGITTAAEVGELQRLGADAQVGMALYTGKMGLGEAIAEVLVSDREDGLWPTVVVDESGVALGMAWSNEESLTEAVETGTGVYHSRSRGRWVKGESSGATQQLRRVDVDCDGDALRFTVRQEGTGFCHLGSRTCWADDPGLGRLYRTIESSAEQQLAGSNTVRLLNEAELLDAKLVEEVGELVEATKTQEVASEAADVMYFAAVKATRAGVSLAAIEQILVERSKRVSRRPIGRKDGG